MSFISSEALHVTESTPEENVKHFFKALSLRDLYRTLILPTVTGIAVFY